METSRDRRLLITLVFGPPISIITEQAWLLIQSLLYYDHWFNCSI